MEKETVLRLADMCGLTPWVKHEFYIDRLIPATDEGIDGDLAGLMQFAQLVAAHEREAIAADADWCIQNNLEQFIPERIRARK